MGRAIRLLLLGVVLCSVVVAGGGCKDDGEITPEPASPEPLSIAIDAPADGVIVDGTSITVSGTVTGDAPVVTVAGVAATVEGSHFEADVPLQAPYTPLLAEATDSSGWVRDRRTVLVGDATDVETPAAQGIALRLTDRGLDALEGFLLSSFSPELVEQMILDSNPLYEGDLVVATITIVADAASVGGLVADLDAQTTGLALGASLTDVSISVVIDAGWAGDYPGIIDIDSTDFTAFIVLGVQDGELTVTVQEIAVNLVGLTMDFEDLPDWLDTGLSWIVPLFLEGLIEDMLIDQVAGAVDDALAGALAGGFELGPVTLALTWQTAAHDDDGVNLVLDAALEIPPDAQGLPAQRLTSPGALPSLPGVTTPGGDPYGAAVVLDDDTLHLVGIGLLASGQLAMVMDGFLPTDPPLPLTSEMLAPMFPSLEDALSGTSMMTLETLPVIPLLGEAAEGHDHVARLHLPGFRLKVGGDLDDDGDADPIYELVLDGALLITADGELGVRGEDMQVTLLSCEIECAADEGQGLAALMELAIGMFAGDLTGALTGLIEGVEMVPLEGGACGPEGDHAAIYSDLVEVEPPAAAP